MADRIRTSVHITPIETLTDENSGTHDVIASEVGRSLGGTADSVGISNYSQTAANQGYKDGAANYLDAVHTAGGVIVSGLGNTDCIYIKNTGFKYSAATTLGASTTDCVMVALRTIAYESGVNGGWITSADAPTIHFIELAWLKPGQAIVLPTGAISLSITQFGSNANDLTKLHEDSGADQEQALIYVRTFASDGSAASDGNAVEFLSVT